MHGCISNSSSVNVYDQILNHEDEFCIHYKQNLTEIKLRSGLDKIKEWLLSLPHIYFHLSFTCDFLDLDPDLSHVYFGNRKEDFKGTCL